MFTKTHRKESQEEIITTVKEWLISFYTKQCGNEIPNFMNKIIYYTANQELIQMAQDGSLYGFYKRIKAGAV